MPDRDDQGDLPTLSGDGSGGGDEPARALPQVEGYEILGPLGEGGMGIVWRAVQQSVRRPVALKLLRAGGFASSKARVRFEREVELAARLEHPHIARVYESGLRQGVYYCGLAEHAHELLPDECRAACLTGARRGQTIHGYSAPEPDSWHDDLLQADGTPHRPAGIEAIKLPLMDA